MMNNMYEISMSSLLFQPLGRPNEMLVEEVVDVDLSEDI
jgi:hypothetical protein